MYEVHFNAMAGGFKACLHNIAGMPLLTESPIQAI